MRYQSIVQATSVEEWLYFQSNRVVESTFETAVAKRLGRELMGLPQLLKMHDLDFQSMDWSFQEFRLALVQVEDGLLVLKLDKDCPLSSSDVLQLASP